MMWHMSREGCAILLQRRGVEMYHEDDVDVRRMERCRGCLRVWTANILYVCHLHCWPNNRPLSTSIEEGRRIV